MNVTSGGPHILLFERDQQLTILLSSELALAGYEVHTARTAVEVFDAIARFPIRLVMVDLAQAQAGRREFWVALDAQRRGRGVQVFTFRCANLAGYGPDDPDERVQTVVTDLEVDGMMGVVKLVEAVRARVPGTLTHSSLPAMRAVQMGRPQEVDIDPAPSLGTRSAVAQHAREMNQLQERLPVEQAPMAFPQAQAQAQAAPPMASAPVPPAYASSSMAAAPTNPALTSIPQPPQQILQGIPRPPASQDMPTLVPQTRASEPPRSGPSTFTDKIRAVIYPSSRNFSPIPEANRVPRNPNAASQQPLNQMQHPEVQARPQANQRVVDAGYSSHASQEEMVYQQPANNAVAGSIASPNYNGVPAGPRVSKEESGLDQLSRMLRENRFSLQSPAAHGNMQQQTVASSAPALTIDQHEIQEFQEQVAQAARLDEAQGRSSGLSARPVEPSGLSVQLRPSPIQGISYERESPGRGGAGSSYASQLSENTIRSAAVVLQSNQGAPPMQSLPPEQGQIPSTEVPRARPIAGEVSTPPRQASPARSYGTQMGQAGSSQVYQASPARSYGPQATQQAGSSQVYQASPAQYMPQQQPYQVSPVRSYGSQSEQGTMSQLLQQSPSMPQYVSASSAQDQGVPVDERAFSNSQVRSMSQIEDTVSETSYPSSMNAQMLSVQELLARSAEQEKREGDMLHAGDNASLADQVQASLQQTMARRPEIRTSDDTLLDIVKSLPPMAPAPQPPQVQVLHGRATRSLGSVLLEGHLVPQERLQVAQHVQRMLRGVDLNYQLGEILLMFKLLTPDQLLAASLVSYGMISTVQISALGRIRQELHAMGLEYDLESLLVLFRILTPEQMREVRASWSS